MLYGQWQSDEYVAAEKWAQDVVGVQTEGELRRALVVSPM